MLASKIYYKYIYVKSCAVSRQACLNVAKQMALIFSFWFSQSAFSANTTRNWLKGAFNTTYNILYKFYQKQETSTVSLMSNHSTNRENQCLMYLDDGASADLCSSQSIFPRFILLCLYREPRLETPRRPYNTGLKPNQLKTPTPKSLTKTQTPPPNHQKWEKNDRKVSIINLGKNITCWSPVRTYTYTIVSNRVGNL